MSNSHRIGAVATIVFLSLALPLGIIVGSLAWALAGKPFGRNLAEFKDYESGVLKNDELWFTVYRPPEYGGTSTFNCRIKRLDIKTGIESETGLTVGNDVCGLILMNDQMLAISEVAIYRCESSSLVRIALVPPQSNNFSASLFPYDGRLTTVVATDNGGHRLLHLIDDKWVEGRKILLPGPDRFWYDDPQSGRKKLLPLSCQQSRSTTTARGAIFDFLAVVADHQRIHLISRSSDGVYGYRKGFEFADQDEVPAVPQNGVRPLATVDRLEHEEQREGVGPRFEAKDEETISALRPENAAQEVSGWEAFPPLSDGDNFASETCDRQGLLFDCWNYKVKSYVLRRNNEGICSRLADPGRAISNHVDHIYVDAKNGSTYLVVGDHGWSFAKFYPIEHDIILPARFTASDGVHEYLARWRHLFAGIACAWLVHQSILIGGIQFLSHRPSDSRYQFGLRHVELASATRRAGAFSIDVVLLLLILSFTFAIPLREFGFTWRSIEEIDLCRILWGIESSLLDRISNDPYINFEIEPLIDHEIELFSILPELFNICLMTAILLCSAKLYVESRYGITPGKWLFGIRTLRTSLRPCGFSRTLIRDTLYCLDSPFFLTVMPAAISMMLSKNRQRLGDRLADTVVVTAASLNESQRRGDDQQRRV